MSDRLREDPDRYAVDKRRARVNGVTGLADYPAAADVLVLGPYISRQGSWSEPIADTAWCHLIKVITKASRRRCEATIEANHQERTVVAEFADAGVNGFELFQPDAQRFLYEDAQSRNLPA